MDFNRIAVRLFAEASLSLSILRNGTVPDGTTFYCEPCREKRVKSDEADAYCDHHAEIKKELAKIIPPEILLKEIQK